MHIHTHTHRIFVPPLHLGSASCVVALSSGPPHLSVRRLKPLRGQQTAGRQVRPLSISQTSTCVPPLCVCEHVCVCTCMVVHLLLAILSSLRLCIYSADRHKQTDRSTSRVASSLYTQSISIWLQKVKLLYCVQQSKDLIHDVGTVCWGGGTGGGGGVRGWWY